MTRKHAYWICQIGGWSLESGISILLVNWETQEGWTVLLNQVLSVALGVGLTHAFRTYVHRAGWLDLSLKRIAPRVVGGAVVLSLGFNVFGDLPVYFGLIDVVPDCYGKLHFRNACALIVGSLLERGNSVTDSQKCAPHTSFSAVFHIGVLPVSVPAGEGTSFCDLEEVCRPDI